MSSDQSGPGGKLVERIEQATELPMLILAVAYIPAFIISYLPDVSPEVRQDAKFMGGLIIAVFAAELAAKVTLADRRLEYLRSRWLDVVIVLLPFLRPLRVFFLLPFLMRVIVGVERILGPYRAAYVLVVGILVVLTGAGLVQLFEDRAGGPIQSFEDALWWAVTTITTVGYGDTYPVTVGGKVVAALVMLVGIALFSVLTAGIAAYFVERTEEEEEREQAEKIDRILKKLDEQEKRGKKVDRLFEKLEENERRIGKRGGHSDEE
jgi:voltage-gated potassium channel